MLHIYIESNVHSHAEKNIKPMMRVQRRIVSEETLGQGKEMSEKLKELRRTVKYD